MTKRGMIIGVSLGVVAVAAAIVIISFIGKTAGGETVEEEQILTVEVKQGTVSVTVEGPSFVEPYRSQDIRSRAAGIVVYAAVEGDMVQEGEDLLRFDRTDPANALRQSELNLEQARLDLRKAEIAYEKAEIDLADKQRLLNSGAVSRGQVDAAKDAQVNAELAVAGARIKVAQNELLVEKSRAELAGSVITAPFSGVVLSANAGAGDVVGSGSLLLTFADVSKVRLRAEVDEFDIGKIRTGMQATVSSDALGEESIRSRVERISPAAEVVNNISIFTVSTVVDNGDGLLRPGMSADLSILVSSDKGIVVPTKAVSTVRGRSYVKVIEEAEVVTKRVTIGADDGVNTAVLEGIEEAALVVLPSTGSLTFTSTAGTTGTTGTSIVPISVPGTGGSR